MAYKDPDVEKERGPGASEPEGGGPCLAPPATTSGGGSALKASRALPRFPFRVACEAGAHLYGSSWGFSVVLRAGAETRLELEVLDRWIEEGRGFVMLDTRNELRGRDGLV